MAQYDELKFEDHLFNYLPKISGTGQWHQLNVHSVKDLWQNFRKIVSRLNTKELNGHLLTPTEFGRLKKELLAETKTPYDAGKFLYGYDGVSQINIKLDDGKNVYLTLFDQAQIGSGDSYYQVARQLEHARQQPGKKNRRFDTTLLINGLPIIQIEEKADGVPNQNALNQMHQYILEGQYQGFFQTLQILIAMNPNDIRYMANTTAQDFNTDYAFHWHLLKHEQDGHPGYSDERAPVNDWRTFADHFLSIPMAHKMATSYMILDNSRGQKSLKVMRSYQVHATQKIIQKLKNYDFELGNQKIGYIWHTTGSGKTISSFKAAYLASRLRSRSTNKRVDKVIYLVDRRALTDQTRDAYQAYDPNTDQNNRGGIVSGASNIHDLKKKIKNKSTKIIVTTSQQIYDLISKDHFKDNQQNVVFIVDEAHQGAGHSLNEIKKAFRRSAWIGYTGTPRFRSNDPKVPTTEQVFGPALHVYTISAAITDDNVLGFRVNFETPLSKRFIPEYFHKKYPHLSAAQVHEKIHDLSPEDVDDEISTTVYDDNPEYVRLVVANVLQHWNQRSRGRKFNALFTTHVGGRHGSSKMVEMYYDEFRRQNQKLHHPLKIAVTFSQDTSDGNNQIRNNELLHKVMQGYNHDFGTSFTDDQVKDYMSDLTNRFTHEIDHGKHMGLDLVIVVDQLLTGFDAHRLNTLYVDRSLKGARLIQAYSRTNRIYDNSKPMGIIVNYRWPHYSKAKMDAALKVYGDPNSINTKDDLRIPKNVVGLPYDILVQKLDQVTSALSQLTGNFSLVSGSESKQDQTLKCLRKYNNLTNQVKQCDGYDPHHPEKLLSQIHMDSDQEAHLIGYVTDELKEKMSKRGNHQKNDFHIHMEDIRKVDQEDVDYDYISHLLASVINNKHAYHNYVQQNSVHDVHAQELSKKLKRAESELYVLIEQLDEQGNGKYAAKIRRLLKLVQNLSFEKNYQGVYPIDERKINQILKQSNESQRDKVIGDFIDYFGLQDLKGTGRIIKLIDQHRLGVNDLNNISNSSVIFNVGYKSYQKQANQKVRKLDPVTYFNTLQKALYQLAEKIKKNY